MGAAVGAIVGADVEVVETETVVEVEAIVGVTIGAVVADAVGSTAIGVFVEGCEKI